MKEGGERGREGGGGGEGGEKGKSRTVASWSIISNFNFFLFSGCISVRYSPEVAIKKIHSDACCEFVPYLIVIEYFYEFFKIFFIL